MKRAEFVQKPNSIKEIEKIDRMRKLRGLNNNVPYVFAPIAHYIEYRNYHN